MQNAETKASYTLPSLFHPTQTKSLLLPFPVICPKCPPSHPTLHPLHTRTNWAIHTTITITTTTITAVTSTSLGFVELLDVNHALDAVGGSVQALVPPPAAR
jgi:hypothetical protein